MIGECPTDEGQSGCYLMIRIRRIVLARLCLPLADTNLLSHSLRGSSLPL
jgi:hypothetical protein